MSHARAVLLAELADWIGLAQALSVATDDLRSRRSRHDPGSSDLSVVTVTRR